MSKELMEKDKRSRLFVSCSIGRQKTTKCQIGHNLKVSLLMI